MSKKNMELYANTIMNEVPAGIITPSEDLKVGFDSENITDQFTKGGSGVNNFSKLMNQMFENNKNNL